MRYSAFNMQDDSNIFDLPLDEEIVDYLTEQPNVVSKQELTKQFKIQGKEKRQAFKDQLRRLIKSKKINKEKGRNYSADETLPSTVRIRIESYDEDRKQFIATFEEPVKSIKYAYILEKDRPKARIGDHFIARFLEVNNNSARLKPLKLYYPELEKFVGVVAKKEDHVAVVTPTNRRIKDVFTLRGDVAKPLKDGELVVIKGNDNGTAEFFESLGHSDDVKNITLIAIHEHDIRTEFINDCIEQAKKAEIPPLDNRTDLRDLAFVTIDGEDARDFDDAVYAYPDGSPKNEGGFVIWVAIADVAYYVPSGSPLDKEALKRGNSTYFPDRVVPMLPEHLSNGLCSINPHEDRACMALKMTIDKNGRLISKKIHRGLMQSKARLTYTMVQEFLDGGMPERIEPIQDHIKNLNDAYKVLRKAREKRGALDIHGSEQKIIMDETGAITEVSKRIQFEAHQLIEEMMILSNVSVAELLEEKGAPCLYRVHESPTYEKIDNLRHFLGGFGYKVPVSSNIKTIELNDLLKKSSGKIEEFIVNESVLRSQNQARYDNENEGHFGLALDRYAHFTSPIRRYADLIVHRSLIRSYKLGNDGLTDKEISQLKSISEDISDLERKSVKAERDATGRLTAIFLSEQEDQIFDGIISGVADPGLFVRLDEYGAEGFIPVRTLPNDFYVLDKESQSFIGRRTKRTYQLMATLKVRLVDIDPVLNNIIFEVATDESATLEGFTFKAPQKSNRQNKHSDSRSRRGNSRGGSSRGGSSRGGNSRGGNSKGGNSKGGNSKGGDFRKGKNSSKSDKNKKSFKTGRNSSNNNKKS